MDLDLRFPARQGSTIGEGAVLEDLRDYLPRAHGQLQERLRGMRVTPELVDELEGAIAAELEREFPAEVGDVDVAVQGNELQVLVHRREVRIERVTMRTIRSDDPS